MADKPHQKLAPDGGPASDFLGNPIVYETVRVKLKAGGTTVVIRASDFNGAIHEKLDAARVKLEKPKEPEGFGIESKDDLLKLTVAQLQAKPEWEKTDKQAKTKEQIVDAILAVREAAE